jgi:hypothetical protein
MRYATLGIFPVSQHTMCDSAERITERIGADQTLVIRRSERGRNLRSADRSGSPSADPRIGADQKFVIRPPSLVVMHEVTPRPRVPGENVAWIA